jgi:hypothetical protein
MIGDEIIKMALARFSRLENDNADIDTIVTIRNVKQNRAVSVLEPELALRMLKTNS